ncbi:hypothetical protein [Sideroxyarcus sp. TK5]
MPYHHVIAKVGTEVKFRELFTDLTFEDLSERFVKPYEKGTSFFSGNDLISPNDLRSVQIIRTERKNEVERDEINRKDRESIDRLNNSSSSVFIVSVGGGYEPQDIAEAGEDLTHTFIKGHPGFKAGRWDPSIKVVAWVGGIVATVIAAGIVKWLGWL